jgi:two-component system OmpR family sensor kinase
VYELAASLEHMRREVLRSEASLRGFVASAAHELRTPLTSIQGFSQALLDGTAATGEQRQRSAATIYRESGRLRRLVDSLLTLSRFDSREFVPNLSSVDAAAIVGEEAKALVEAGSTDPGRIVIRHVADTTLVTDADMFRQVVGNLLRNAVQYGGGEPVEVIVGGDAANLEFTVRNRGVPLNEVDRHRVFERFYRGRSSQRTEGSGLGLPLVKEICEVLGGSVELVPDEDGLTVFRVTMPRRSQGEGE